MADSKLYQRSALSPGASDIIYLSRADGSGDGYQSFTGLASTLGGVLAPTFAALVHTHAYADLTGLPTLFSGAYADLTGKPTLGTAAAIDIDTDGTLAANSDAKIATQKAVKTYVAAAVGAGVADGDKGDVVVSSTGTVWTIDTNAVGDTKLRQSAGLSIIGRTANSTGNVADITAASDGQVMRRSGTAIGFGAVDLASANSVTGVLPSANQASQAGRLIGVQVITATGAGTYTPTTGTTSIVIELQGGGGQGGGIASPGSSKAATAAGGAGGGYLRKRLTSAFSGAAYSVGAGGTTTTAGASTGQTGGNTTFTATGGGGTVYTASGGPGGSGQSGLTAIAYSGATAGSASTNGDINMHGGPSSNGISLSATLQVGAKGGASFFDTGAAALDVNAANTTTTGGAAVNYGGGGGGAVGNGTGVARAGGAGGNGVIIIWEYS